MRQSVTSNQVMKLPSQAGNGEKYLSREGRCAPILSAPRIGAPALSEELTTQSSSSCRTKHVSSGKVYFTLAIERGLWHGLRSFPKRLRRLASRPTADVHGRGRQCPLYVCAVTRRRFPVGASPTRPHEQSCASAWPRQWAPVPALRMLRKKREKKVSPLQSS